MNEKKNSIILIIIFYTILVLPTFIYPLIKTKMDNTNYENRVLSNFDIVYNSGIRDLPSNFDLYYKDNLPFKNELQKIRASIKYMFKASTDSKVIIGENGWLFFNSGVDGITDEIGDYNKTTRLTQEQYDLVNENLNFINDKLAQKKINFYVFIPSNKTSIYPEYMPKIYNRNNEVTENKVDALVKNIKETTKVNVIYPKEELIKYKTIADTYYKYDTHWNAFGGLVGVSTILENVENEKIKIEDLTIEKENISFGDLAKMNQTLAFTDEDTPIVKGYYDDVK